MNTSHGTTSKASQLGSGSRLSPEITQTSPAASIRICAEPRTCPAGWNETVVSPNVSGSPNSWPSTIASGPRRGAAGPLRARRVIVARAAPRMIPVGMGDDGAFNRAPGVDVESAQGQYSPSGLSGNQVRQACVFLRRISALDPHRRAIKGDVVLDVRSCRLGIGYVHTAFGASSSPSTRSK